MSNLSEKTLVFISALSNAYKGYEEREDFPQIELPADDVTEDFTAMLITLSLFYEELTDDNTDLIGFTHILNRLAVQHIMNENKEKEDNNGLHGRNSKQNISD